MFLFLHSFICFLLYGSWEAIHSSKILPRGPPTFSTPGETIPRLFQKSKMLGPIPPRIFDPSKFPNLTPDLDNDCIPNLSDPHRVVDNTLLYRHFLFSDLGPGMIFRVIALSVSKPFQIHLFRVGPERAII